MSVGVRSGWFLDLSGRYRSRYWNGRDWTAWVLDERGRVQVDALTGGQFEARRAFVFTDFHFPVDGKIQHLQVTGDEITWAQRTVGFLSIKSVACFADGTGRNEALHVDIVHESGTMRVLLPTGMLDAHNQKRCQQAFLAMQSSFQGNLFPLVAFDIAHQIVSGQAQTFGPVTFDRNGVTRTQRFNRKQSVNWSSFVDIRSGRSAMQVIVQSAKGQEEVFAEVLVSEPNATALPNIMESVMLLMMQPERLEEYLRSRIPPEALEAWEEFAEDAKLATEQSSERVVAEAAPETKYDYDLDGSDNVASSDSLMGMVQASFDLIAPIVSEDLSEPEPVMAPASTIRERVIAQTGGMPIDVPAEGTAAAAADVLDSATRRRPTETVTNIGDTIRPSAAALPVAGPPAGGGADRSDRPEREAPRQRLSAPKVLDARPASSETGATRARRFDTAATAATQTAGPTTAPGTSVPGSSMPPPGTTAAAPNRPKSDEILVPPPMTDLRLGDSGETTPNWMLPGRRRLFGPNAGAPRPQPTPLASGVPADLGTDRSERPLPDPVTITDRAVEDSPEARSEAVPPTEAPPTEAPPTEAPPVVVPFYSPRVNSSRRPAASRDPVAAPAVAENENDAPTAENAAHRPDGRALSALASAVGKPRTSAVGPTASPALAPREASSLPRRRAGLDRRDAVETIDPTQAGEPVEDPGSDEAAPTAIAKALSPNGDRTPPPAPPTEPSSAVSVAEVAPPTHPVATPTRRNDRSGRAPGGPNGLTRRVRVDAPKGDTSTENETGNNTAAQAAEGETLQPHLQSILRNVAERDRLFAAMKADEDRLHTP